MQNKNEIQRSDFFKVHNQQEKVIEQALIKFMDQAFNMGLVTDNEKQKKFLTHLVNDLEAVLATKGDERHVKIGVMVFYSLNKSASTEHQEIKNLLQEFINDHFHHADKIQNEVLTYVKNQTAKHLNDSWHKKCKIVLDFMQELGDLMKPSPFWG